MEEESLRGRATFPDARALKSKPLMGWMTAVAGSCSNGGERNKRNVTNGAAGHLSVPGSDFLHSSHSGTHLDPRILFAFNSVSILY